MADLRLQHVADELFLRNARNKNPEEGAEPGPVLSEQDLVAELKAKIAQSPKLLEQAVHSAATEALSNARCTMRLQITKKPENFKVKQFSPAFQAAVVDACGKFYGWPLSGGLILRDADRDAVMKDAEMHRRNALGAGRNATFLELVASKLTKGKKVGDVFTEQQLEQLMRKAERGS